MSLHPTVTSTGLGLDGGLTPQVGVDKSLVTKLNGKVLETLGQEKNWVVYAVQPGEVVQGMNVLSCTLGVASETPITINDMLLQVRY